MEELIVFSVFEVKYINGKIMIVVVCPYCTAYANTLVLTNNLRTHYYKTVM